MPGEDVCGCIVTIVVVGYVNGVSVVLKMSVVSDVTAVEIAGAVIVMPVLIASVVTPAEFPAPGPS